MEAVRMTSFLATLCVLLMSFATRTDSVHLYGRKRAEPTVDAPAAVDGGSTRATAMSSREEVRAFEGWVERVRAKYELSAELEGIRVPDDLPDDNVFSALKMRVDRVITVNKVAGLGNFQSVGGAINAVPKHNVQRTIIHIAAGVYKEKVKIPKDKPFITLIGEGMNNTIITWDDTASSSSSTFRSATFSVMAPGFVAKGIAFQNTAPAPPPGAKGAQAVAFQISGDQSAVFGCAFLGAQDTLYDHRGRHYFKDCWIQGSIDFIFGDGLSLYEGCVLYAIDTPSGSLTAQKRKTSSEDTGFSFVNCTISGSGVVYLGRAWGEFSRVVFIYTHIETIVMPGGWNDWGIPSREKTSFYGEYKCWGRGADLHNRVAWSHQLTDEQAHPFMSTSFVDGQSWIASIS